MTLSSVEAPPPSLHYCPHPLHSCAVTHTGVMSYEIVPYRLGAGLTTEPAIFPLPFL